MKRIATLDGIRGVAITLVIVGHAIAHWPNLSIELRSTILAIFDPGFGVRVFFVLSGFLITSLMLQEQSRTGTIRLGAFYIRRARRILPAFYVYLIVIAIWMKLNGEALAWQRWAEAATFTWNYAGLWRTSAGPTEGWNLGHLWSLCVEGQFYLLWPPLFLTLGRRNAIKLTLVVILFSPALRVISYFAFPTLRGNIGMMLHTGSDALAMGCLAALIAANPTAIEIVRRKAKWGLALSLTWVAIWGPFGRLELRGFHIIVGFTGDALVAAWWILSMHAHSYSFAQQCIGRGILPRLGLISYSLYLWQQPFLGPNGSVARGNWVLGLLGPVTVAILSFVFIEKRFMKPNRAIIAPPAAPRGSRISS